MSVRALKGKRQELSTPRQALGQKVKGEGHMVYDGYQVRRRWPGSAGRSTLLHIP